MGLISAAGNDYEDLPTTAGNLTELSAAAHFLPRCVHHSQGEEDIEMGLIRAAANENEDPSTIDGNLTELCRLQAILLKVGHVTPPSSSYFPS